MILPSLTSGMWRKRCMQEDVGVVDSCADYWLSYSWQNQPRSQY